MPNHPVIVRHRGVGGRAAFVRDGQIVLAEGDREEIVISLDRLPLTRGGQVGFQVENSLAAIAAAWSLGIPLDVIRARAESIAADIDKVPARFNVLEIEGATVVVDYGHNTPLAGRRDRGPRQVPAPPPHVRLLDGRRPPRLRHRPPGRTARRRVRSRHPLRGPLSPRPRRRARSSACSARDWQSATRTKEIVEVAGRHEGRRGRAEVRPSRANSCSSRPTRSTKPCNGSAAISPCWPRGRRADEVEPVLAEPVAEPALVAAPAAAVRSSRPDSYHGGADIPVCPDTRAEEGRQNCLPPPCVLSTRPAAPRHPPGNFSPLCGVQGLHAQAISILWSRHLADGRARPLSAHPI